GISALDHHSLHVGHLDFTHLYAVEHHLPAAVDTACGNNLGFAAIDLVLQAQAAGIQFVHRHGVGAGIHQEFYRLTVDTAVHHILVEIVFPDDNLGDFRLLERAADGGVQLQGMT